MKKMHAAGGRAPLLSKTCPSPNNGAIHNVAEIIKAVMSSAAEAEAVEERNILQELGHKQPPTPIQTDNSTAEGIVNNRVQPKAHKSHGYAISLAARPSRIKNNSAFIGDRGRRTGVITLPNTTQPASRNMRPELLTPHKVLMALRRLQNMGGGSATGTTARVC
eukprot:CCRYP_001354-RA/>CCRYP_001354-RA protein AED:0.46 eAED:0.44 QI:0/0/0/1/1/1/2/0/163